MHSGIVLDNQKGPGRRWRCVLEDGTPVTLKVSEDAACAIVPVRQLSAAADPLQGSRNIWCEINKVHVLTDAAGIRPARGLLLLRSRCQRTDGEESVSLRFPLSFKRPTLLEAYSPNRGGSTRAWRKLIIILTSTTPLSRRILLPQAAAADVVPSTSACSAASAVWWSPEGRQGKTAL